MNFGPKGIIYDSNMFKLVLRRKTDYIYINKRIGLKNSRKL